MEPFSPQEIEHRRALAEAGIERVRQATSLAERAAQATVLDVALGLSRGRLSSKQENGWAWCQYHGFLRAVDKNGKYALTGVCEACWRETFSPEALAFRSQAARQAQADLEAQAESLVEPDLDPSTGWVGPGDEPTEPRPVEGSLGPSSAPVPAADVVDRVPAPPVVDRGGVPGATASSAPVDADQDIESARLDAWIRSMGTGS